MDSKRHTSIYYFQVRHLRQNTNDTHIAIAETIMIIAKLFTHYHHLTMHRIPKPMSKKFLSSPFRWRWEFTARASNFSPYSPHPQNPVHFQDQHSQTHHASCLTNSAPISSSTALWQPSAYSSFYLPTSIEHTSLPQDVPCLWCLNLNTSKHSHPRLLTITTTTSVLAPCARRT